MGVSRDSSVLFFFFHNDLTLTSLSLYSNSLVGINKAFIKPDSEGVHNPRDVTYTPYDVRVKLHGEL